MPDVQRHFDVRTAVEKETGDDPAISTEATNVRARLRDLWS